MKRAPGLLFDEHNYGWSNFRDFLKRMDHRVEVTGNSGHDIIIALRE